jgi:hypothetical protein
MEAREMQPLMRRGRANGGDEGDIELDEDALKEVLTQRVQELVKVREEQRLVDYSVRLPHITTVISGAIVMAIVYIILVSAFGRNEENKRVRVREGGDFGGVAGTAFIDDAAVALMLETMQRITDECSLAPSNPVLNNVRLGSRAQTNAGWDAIKADIAPTGPDFVDGCNFYGLAAAELRTDRKIGPVDICHGYVHVGLTMFQVIQRGVFDGNTSAFLSAAYNLAYPLNIFWQVDVSKGNKQDVINQAALFLLDIDLQSDVRQIAIEFCNPFFADLPSEQTFYQQPTQPWLGFPFPGAFQREGHSSINKATAEEIIGGGIASVSDIKKMYIFGDVILQSPASRLFIDAVAAAVPRVEFADTAIGDKLAVVVDDITDDFGNVVTAFVPVTILGRYTQDRSIYNSLPKSQNNILYLLTDEDPDDVLVEIINVEIASSCARLTPLLS